MKLKPFGVFSYLKSFPEIIFFDEFKRIILLKKNEVTLIEAKNENQEDTEQIASTVS